MEYESINPPLRQNECAEIRGWIGSGEAVVLTCFERDSENCRRGRVAGAVKR